MRIFIIHASSFLTDSEAHGDGLVAFGFIEHLAAQGHDLHVVTDRVALTKPLPSNVHLYHGGSSQPMSLRLAYALRARKTFERLHREKRFDIAHQLNPVFAGLSLGFIGCGVPVVLGTFVGEWPRTPKGSRVKRVVSRMAKLFRSIIEFAQQRFASALLVTTPAAAERLVGVTKDDDRLFTLPNGIDTDCFMPSAFDRAEAPSIRALCGLSEKKGAFTLIDAFAAFAERDLRTRLVIGGVADTRAIESVRLRYPSLSDRLEFVGAVSRTALPAFLNAATVFCVPSFGEPYGMAAIEAMACGVPVVATDAGGLKYLVTDRNGRTFRPGDISALSAAFQQLLSDGDTLVAYGAYNRRETVLHHAWDPVIKELERIYQLCIDAASRRSV